MKTVLREINNATGMKRTVDLGNEPRPVNDSETGI